jgi:HD-GYP domain-containing protein (c-di-GMP phosphodiesterase class II)
MRALSPPARLYVLGVALAGAVVVAWALWDVVRGRSTPDGARLGALVTLGAVYVVADNLNSRADERRPEVALGSVIVIAAIPIVGTAGAVLVSALSLLARDGSPPTKRVFNGAQVALSAAAAGGIYTWLGGDVSLDRSSFPQVLLHILAADVVHCLVNGLLVAVVVALVERVPMRAVFQGTMAASALPYLGYGLYGLLLAVLWDGADVGPPSALLVLLPLVVARWAYRQYVAEREAYDRTIRTLVAAVETKDHYTRGHSERVARGAVMIARVIGMREDRVRSLHSAGVLHDVGKLGVPTRLLHKGGRLTDAEFEAVKLHPVRGLEMVREIEVLEEAFAGIMHHHERLDGRGYPMGLRGTDIPEFARVIAVADAFDAMTSNRSYRRSRTTEEAVAELRRWAGTQFEPRMVEALVEALAAHGWECEPAPPVPVGEEPDEAYFDHDDPTVSRPSGGRPT